MNPSNRFTPKIRREKTYVTTSDSDNCEKKNAVQVFCRLKTKETPCIKLESATKLILETPVESKGVRKEIECKFKHIFTAFASQREIFEHVSYPLLQDLIRGQDGLLFTYGVTGSGKTYTLTGEPENPGIVPRSIYTIFNSISDYQAPKYHIKPDGMNGFEVQSEQDAMQEKLNEIRTSRTPKSTRKAPREVVYVNDATKIQDINPNNTYSVFVSYVEIYNNTVFDLLEDNGSRSLQSKILREDACKRMYVNGVIEVEVKSAEEAFELFNIGQKKKKMGNTVLNSVSSRSHSIFNIRLVQLHRSGYHNAGDHAAPSTDQLRVSQLSFVDLAGSERTNRTQNTGKLLKEASQINNSLMTLRNCLEVLRENQIYGTKKLVPYRDSRLTLLFKNHFEGEGMVKMVVCVNPSLEDFEENLQVMKFAECSQEVKVVPRSVVDSRYNTPVKKTIYKKANTPRPAIKTKGSFSLGPNIPDVKLNFRNSQESIAAIERLLSVLKTRKSKLTNLDGELAQKEAHFRKRLLTIEQDHLLARSELKSTRMQLKKEKQKNCNLEVKNAEMETEKNDLIAKQDELHNIIRNLQGTISEKELKINKNILEKEKTKQKLALEKEKMTHELDTKLRRQRDYLEANARVNKTKIQQVIDLLNRPVEVADKVATPARPEKPERPEPPKRPVLREFDNNNQQTPQKPRRNLIQTPSATRRRRSKSAGDIWLEHNSVKPVALGTVMQPTMKKRKSITKLTKASDVTNPKQTKYCLLAQEPDREGELETKLYKADILPTCGGGAQVIFNDVERLRQESPTRPSDE